MATKAGLNLLILDCIKNKTTIVLYIGFFFLFSNNFIYCQKFSSLSKFEKRWVLSHPFAAVKCKKLYKQVYPILIEVKKNGELDIYENGGKLDAFRHSFVMAVYAQKIKVKKIRKLGMAHERGNELQFKNKELEEGELPDSVGVTMDIYNNEIGFKIGSSNKKINSIDLKLKVMEAIENQQMLFVSRNQFGEYLDCNKQIINLEFWKNKWNVPKCLVSK
jgi:hypothetical protein